MDLYDWLLFLHVLAAFLLVAGLVSYGVLVMDGRAALRGVLARPASALWNGGAVGVLVFGVWLALKEYEIWDAWIIAALVLWLIGGGAAGKLERAVRDGGALTGLRVNYVLMALATLLLLVDMIFKPGA
jgi:hypothetical protein